MVFSYVIYNMVYIQMYHRATRVHIEHYFIFSVKCVCFCCSELCCFLLRTLVDLCNRYIIVSSTKS